MYDIEALVNLYKGLGQVCMVLKQIYLLNDMYI